MSSLNNTGRFGLNLTLLTAEAVFIAAAFIVCTFVWGDFFDAPDLVLALIAFSLKYPVGLALVTGFWAGFKPIVMSWALIVSILLGLGYATGYASVFNPMVLVTWVVSVPLILYAARQIAVLLLPRIIAINGRRAVIVGVTERGRELAQQFAANPLHGVKVAGFFDSRDPSRLDNAAETRVMGGLATLPEFVKANAVQSVYITLPMSSQPRILKLLDELRDTTVSIYFVPLIADMIHARFANISGISVLAVRETPFPFLGLNALVKRVEDVVLSMLILMLISPLVLLIAVGVKLSSPGPVIFRQRRYGLDGKEIFVYKFRTMRVIEDGDAQYQQVSKDDLRVTRLGAWLRKTSLDEVPQFFNVLQGRMSVVGPRPHVVAVNEQYRRMIPGYMIRHKIKPGITGWAQINGYRGGDDLEQMKKRIEFDLQYLSNWSLALDVAIFFRTLPIFVRGDRNAY